MAHNRPSERRNQYGFENQAQEFINETEDAPPEIPQQDTESTSEALDISHALSE